MVCKAAGRYGTLPAGEKGTRIVSGVSYSRNDPRSLFFRLFEQHGFHPEKQVPVSPTDGGAPISVADFAVPQRRVAIYVDGAAFHTGVNLRRDRYIRTRLREGSPPGKVVELTAADLRRGAELIAELNAL